MKIFLYNPHPYSLKIPTSNAVEPLIFVIKETISDKKKKKIESEISWRRG